MPISLDIAIQKAQENRIYSSIPLTAEQFDLLYGLNQFAIHQAMNESEVRQMPAKMIYKVNEEFKLALVALLTTCALLNPKRNATDMETFFQKQLNIIQLDTYTKRIDFGGISQQLIGQFLIREMVNDWILYRDCCGDGIHALVDYKTSLQGLETYQRGGTPVYEFARFYRKFMEQKIKNKQQLKQDFQQVALKTLSERLIDQQLQLGINPEQILNQISSGQFFPTEQNIPAPKKLGFKK